MDLPDCQGARKEPMAAPTDPVYLRVLADLRVQIRDGIPRDPTGKLLRNKLRDELWS